MITFIIPTIGRSSLNQTIQSLLNQSDGQWKANIIYDRCDPFGYQDNRINEFTIYSDSKFGGNARNLGLDHVDTEYVGFVDDDDTLGEDYVKIFYKTIPADVIMWRAQYLDDCILPIPGRKDIEVGNIGIFFCYNFKKYPDIRFVENSVCEDYMFVKELSERTEFIWSNAIVYHVPKPLFAVPCFEVERIRFKSSE